MGASRGPARGRPYSEMNVVPMIDVLLVLLVIFMVVQQGLRSGIGLQVPPSDASYAVQTEQMVLTISPGPEYRLNSVPIAAGRLAPDLHRIFAERPRKVLFVDAADDLTYGEVIHAVDASRAAGVEIVGVFPRAGADGTPR